MRPRLRVASLLAVGFATTVGWTLLHLLASCSEGAPASPQLVDVAVPGNDDAGDPSDAGASDAADDGDAATCSIQLPNCPATPPSWSGQVSAIVDRSCGGCHGHGGVAQAQANLATYATAQRAGFGSILQNVYSCLMPEPDAAPLAPADQQALLEWLVCGAPDN